MPTVKVAKNAEKPESKEILAEAITRIGDGFELLQRNGINKKAVIVLIHDATKISKRDITIVLESLPRLKSWYCR